MAFTPEERRRDVSRRAAARVLREHTAAHRAATLEGYVNELVGGDTAPAAGARGTAAHPASTNAT